MRTSLRTLGPAAIACALFAATASAQTTSTESSDAAVRPAFATSEGDTGLWYVPTAEVLARGTWSLSAYRVGLNYVPGFSNVADIPVTGAVGVMRGVEVFGS